MSTKKQTSKKTRSPKRVKLKSIGASQDALQHLTKSDAELDDEHRKRIANYKKFQKYLSSKDAKEVRELLENGLSFEFSEYEEERSVLRAYYHQDRKQIVMAADLEPEARPALVLGMASILTHSFNSFFLEISGLREPSTTFKDMQELLTKISKS